MTCATKFIYSAFATVRVASTAEESRCVAASAASTTSAEPASSSGGGCGEQGGCVWGGGGSGGAGWLFSADAQQLQRISQRTFHQPLGTKRRPLPFPTPFSDLLFSSRPQGLVFRNLDLFLGSFFFVLTFGFSSATELKPQENKITFRKKKTNTSYV